jgi:hypothetical protein
MEKEKFSKLAEAAFGEQKREVIRDWLVCGKIDLTFAVRVKSR